MAESEQAIMNTPKDVGISVSELTNKIDIEKIQTMAEQSSLHVLAWAQSPQFYAQLGLIFAAIIVAFLASKFVGKSIKAPSDPPQSGSMSKWREFLYRLKGVLFSLFAFIFLGIASVLSDAIVDQSWLIKIAQGLSVVAVIYSVSRQFVNSDAVKKFVKWVIIPIAVLYVFGWLDDLTNYLDSIKLQLGNITVSLYAFARVLIFGSILFWLGRVSNQKGKQFILKQEKLESRAKEAYAKLFEIALFVVIFFLLLQVMGINLTTLAVFGGALGVGLGFGLQAIASNFISGLIILLDRSLTVGDYIELEDGRSGTIRALNMRSTTLETFEGKDIMVPNESFITTSFTNWTRKNKKQRYSIEFQVAYSTDIEKLVEILKEVVARHPQVLSGDQATFEELPDAEISGFGDSGIDILVEFWMSGIDDGSNRVGGDLNMMIWKALKENNISFPFPQREVRILNPS
ncbi:MAG: mechanosensitive ion channel [Gammaproteobacteria bacterium]